MKKTKYCLVCGKEYTKNINCSLKNWEKSKYCSPQCQNHVHCFKKGQKAWNKGKKRTWESPSEFKQGFKWGKDIKRKMRGRISWNKGKPWSEEVKKQISKKLKGQKPWNTGKGMTPEDRLQRNRNEYKEWRKTVLQRDNFTCVLCGYKSYTTIKGKSDIVADHIKPFALYAKLRLDIDNGRTLCVACHRQTETYGVNKQYFKHN